MNIYSIFKGFFQSFFKFFQYFCKKSGKIQCVGASIFYQIGVQGGKCLKSIDKIRNEMYNEQEVKFAIANRIHLHKFALANRKNIEGFAIANNEMGYITAKEAAEKWGVTPRRVQILCANDRIKGAVRFGKSWMIPDGAVLPNSANKDDPRLPMPRKSPFLDMTDLYNVVGGADECATMLVNNPEAHALFEAEISYRRGEIAKVYKHARYFLDSHSGFYAILGAGMLLANCALWSGDVSIWYEAKKHICEAPSTTEHEREIISLTLAVIDSSIYNNQDFPEWFESGNFEVLDPDSHPAAKVYYIKYLYMMAFALASGKDTSGDIKGLGLMKLIPKTIEPLITQATVDKTIVPEAYLRLSCAVAYQNVGNIDKAVLHIDKAIDLLLPDGMFGIFAEYSRHFDGLLEERIGMRSADALLRVKELAEIYERGWTRLAAAVRQQSVVAVLTPKERKIAKLVAFGFSHKEIGYMEKISESTVKQTITRIVQKTGISDRHDIPKIL